MSSTRLWDTASHQGARAQEINMQGFEASGASNIVHKVGGVGQNSQRQVKTTRTVLSNCPRMQFQCRATATRGNGGWTHPRSLARSNCQSISRQVILSVHQSTGRSVGKTHLCFRGLLSQRTHGHARGDRTGNGKNKRFCFLQRLRLLTHEVHIIRDSDCLRSCAEA